jgi:hypothetical protein
VLEGAVPGKAIGVPVQLASWPSLFVDIEAGNLTLKSKGAVSFEPGEPCFFVLWPKTLFQMTMGIKFIVALIRGPDE